ncbi:MAG: L-aspartate oxidase [Bacteroidales bacterium]|nr:L-aspartate oxidase [Bacteroidales bacterium]MCB8998742.1 L-aspartate oxidase [Bacteroidales bacterium]
MEKKVDFLVIGTGLGGLSYALKVADFGTVCIITKAKLEETNTSYAQGGIAAVTSESDNYEKHIKDTLIAGDGINNEEVVRMVVREAPDQIRALINWGTQFDRESNGNYDLAKEGGHSEHRILHHKDQTGAEIQRALSERARKHKNIEILEDHFAVELITQHHLGRLVKRYNTDIECFGSYVLNLKTGKTIKILSKVTLLATGGAGNLYQTTTNPHIATGDGVAMVYRAKGIISDMEFVQFHPTSLYNPAEKPSFLISEAMRGFGAILKNQNGSDLMKKYDPRGSLAPRDIVARAIDNEMKIKGHDYVYLDCRHLDHEGLIQHFPYIYEKCKKIGIDMFKEMIPVVPAAHFMCGGILVDTNGKSWINHLYAVGETACTGLHGANRLASNSLLEAIVYAERASKHSLSIIKEINIQRGIPEWNEEGTAHPEEMILITQNYKEVQQIMTNYVGIVRSELRLERAAQRLEIIFQETDKLYKKSILSKELCELRNLINVGYLVIKSAQARKESCGLHYMADHPGKK